MKKGKKIKDAEVIEEKDVFLEGKSIDEIIEADNNKKGKNYWAVVVLLAGALIGSLFVDFAQLMSKEGYSTKALKAEDTKIFAVDGKTWVSYKEPIVKLKVVTVAEEALAECPTCKPPKEVTDLFGKVIPTLVTEDIDIESEEGKKLIEKNNIKSLPAMVFSGDIEETEFYGGEAKVLFSEKNEAGNYMLNLAGLGLPVGKYIETPTIEDSNPTIGNKDAAVKLVLFSDHQCPYCAKFFNDIVSVAKEFGDKVVLVYKDLPLEFHPQAMNAAIAGECAKDQDKFWEMSAKLYPTQKKWGSLEDDKAKEFFKKQAAALKLNTEEFDICLDEERHKDEIEKSKQQAKEFGISGTPSMFINDEFVGGVVPVEQLKTMIQAKIDEVGNVVEEEVVSEDNTNNTDNTDNTQPKE